MLDYNVHLRGRHGYTDETSGELVNATDDVDSPALDAGDPSVDYRQEPYGMNGKRVNLGRYGNTPWASRSAPSWFSIRVR